MDIFVFTAVVLGLFGLFFVLEGGSLAERSAQALYLVSRVGTRHGFEVQERPLSILLPWGSGTAELHYHLLAAGEERDSIALTAERGGPSRLGNLVIESLPVRVYGAGLKRLVLGVPLLDGAFQIFTEPDREAGVRALLEHGGGELLRLVRDLSCRSRGGHFQLVDLGGKVKVQLDDSSLRFPTDVERITLDLVRLYQLYRDLTGERDVAA